MSLTAPITAALTAVHVDASVRQVARPLLPKIRLARGTNAIVALTVKNSDNTRANITGAAIILTVWTAAGVAIISRIATITDAAQGECRFRFMRSDTGGDGADIEPLALGTYYYTVEASWSTGDREQLAPLTELILRQAQPAGEPVTTPEVEEIIGYGVPVVQSGDADFYVTDRVSVVFDTPMPDANYTITLSGGIDGDDGGLLIPVADQDSRTAEGFDIVLGAAGSGVIGWSVHE